MTAARITEAGYKAGSVCRAAGADRGSVVNPYRSWRASEWSRGFDQGWIDAAAKSAPRRSDTGRRKLTDTDVERLREEYRAGNVLLVHLALRAKLHVFHLRMILSGKLYRNVRGAITPEEFLILREQTHAHRCADYSDRIPAWRAEYRRGGIFLVDLAKREGVNPVHLRRMLQGLIYSEIPDPIPKDELAMISYRNSHMRRKERRHG